MSRNGHDHVGRSGEFAAIYTRQVTIGRNRLAPLALQAVNSRQSGCQRFFFSREPLMSAGLRHRAFWLG